MGWYRHITLATLAHAVLTALAAQAREAGGCRDGSALVPLTVAELRRLLATLLPHPLPRQDGRLHGLNRSLRRRRHQATARRCHYRRRTSSGNEISLEHQAGRVGCGGAVLVPVRATFAGGGQPYQMPRSG